MAKVSLNKITPIKSGEIKEIKIADQIIQVRQYLPVNEKIALTERILTSAFDDSNHYSNYRLHILTEIEIIRAYTNINITDKQMENIPNLYDLLELNNIIYEVNNAIPAPELNILKGKIQNEAENLQKYLNSFVGTMKTITNDYNTTQMDVDKLTNELKDPSALSTVKEILDKIG